MTSRRFTCASLAALALLAAGRTASAGDAASLPRLVISPSALSFSEPGDARVVTFTNAGSDVLRLGAVSIVTTGSRGSTDFVIDAAGPRELEPGASGTLTVTYRLPPGAAPTQTFAALLVPADDPALPLDLDLGTGAPVARRLGTVALRAGQTHALTWMILLPLLGAGLVLRAPWRRALALAAGAAPLAIAAWVITRFDPAFAVADGNHGLQLVAHVSLVRALGFEYFVGVDGVSLLFVLLAPLVGVVALAAPRQKRPPAALASVLLVQAGATGVFVAIDGLLLALFWGMAAAGLASLAGKRARGVGAAAIVSAALLLLALVAIRGQSGATYLVDGTPVAHTFDLAKLAHADADGVVRRLFPVLAWGVLLVAFGLALPLFPFSTPLTADAPAETRFLLGGLFSKMALYGLCRVGLALLPPATRAPMVVPILIVAGSLAALRAAVLATKEEGLTGLSARAGELCAAIAVLGLASLAPAGIAGALAIAFAHGLVAALLFALGAQPLGRVPLVAALAASLGVPGLATFVGLALVVVGAAPGHPALSISILAAFAILTGAYARVGARLWLRAPADAADVAETAFDRRTLVLVVPLALLVLALGLVPKPVLASIATSVLELARLAS